MNCKILPVMYSSRGRIRAGQLAMKASNQTTLEMFSLYLTVRVGSPTHGESLQHYVYDFKLFDFDWFSEKDSSHDSAFCSNRSSCIKLLF